MHPLNSKRSPASFAGATLFVGFLFLLSVTANAQSGRRSTAKTVTVPTVSGPKPVEKPPEPPAKDTRTSLVVTAEEQDMFSRIPYYLVGMVRDTCGDSLRKSPLLKVTIGATTMTSSEAVKRAKEEKEAYVVWLQLGSDYIDSGRTSTTETPESLYIRFTIFTPVTAKIKASGRTYYNVTRNRGSVLGRIPGSRSTSVYSEYSLKQAALEAAERILSALKLNLPITTIPG